mmetsp:Transcript_22179/g.25505  ORF Transcript_22179/g.25505 Transcript_22179/m.25505 type:complete len:1567 (+) Transcript_22179:308-5008(+)
MAPITATTIGVSRQTIDDVKLLALIKNLSTFHVAAQFSDDGSCEITDFHQLVAALQKFPEKWEFEEQADLYDWVKPLNAIDHVLTYILRTNPGIVLVGIESGVCRDRGSLRAFPDGSNDDDVEDSLQSIEVDSTKCSVSRGKFKDVIGAGTLAEVQTVSATVLSHIETMLRFLSTLLKNAVNKNVFNSVDSLTLLLSAADDNIAALALEVLAHLALPPMIHRQQAPEMQQHTTALHSSSLAASHAQIVVLARGWGSRGSGLGLHTCITFDDSQQDSLPQHAGNLNFEFFEKATSSPSGIVLSPSSPTSSKLINIHIPADEMVGREEGFMVKKPKISTAKLFFRCLEEAGGKDRIPAEKLFALLANIRLAQSFHSRVSRIGAVKRRLHALSCILHVHPSNEVLMGYFHAQPELVVELVDLVKPAVSSASVSSGIAVDATSELPIPHRICILAHDTLTGLVMRRDGSAGGLSPAARQTNVLGELGVSKGQYLGLLPTLIRFVLASLNVISMPKISSTPIPDQEDNSMNEDYNDLDLDMGLAFVEATKPPSLPHKQQLYESLEFVDSVLTITTAVVSVPQGTTALTDCGLIPSLINAIALDTNSSDGDNGDMDDSYSKCLRKFITAHAVQILEVAIVTHPSALTAFHDLKGVELLVCKLSGEIEQVQNHGESILSKKNKGIINGKDTSLRPLCASQRVMMFSIVNCLTVVFHQQETSSAPSGGTQLRKPELTMALIDILDHVPCYGGMLAALTATLLSDVMNSDPLLVHHVHSSGIATSFLNMMSAEKKVDDNGLEYLVQSLPPISELLMALPNVLSALALTEEGAAVVRKKNPFPSLFALFMSPKYTMPRSRCLLNEMTAIVGTGIDELMRHVPVVKNLGIKSLVDALKRLVVIGQILVVKEDSAEDDNFINTKETGSDVFTLEDSRTSFMQYAFNLCQLLEQILHNSEHTKPFVEAGGLDVLLSLYPLLLPTNSAFLAQISCLSNPSLSNLTHYSTSIALNPAMKSIASHYDAQKLIKKLSESLDEQLNEIKDSEEKLKQVISVSTEGNGILENIPQVALHTLPLTAHNTAFKKAFSAYLRQIAVAEWLITNLSSSIRSASQRGNDSTTGWVSDRDQAWKKELASSSFAKLMERINALYISAQMEMCNVKTTESFEVREVERRKPAGPSNIWHPAVYRLRIVCQDGAVVRNGIEIDSCASVGSLEMGEIVEAHERCINSCGVTRYKTRKGWVSEQTRGHGREPIVEVLSVSGSCKGFEKFIADDDVKRKRVECGIADLVMVGSSILGRLHSNYRSLLSCLSRIIVQSLRSLPLPPRLPSQTSQVVPFAGKMVNLIVTNLTDAFEMGLKEIDGWTPPWLVDSKLPKVFKKNDLGLSMYFASCFELLYSCFFEEKRERRVLNTPLLISFFHNDGMKAGISENSDADKGCEKNEKNTDETKDSAMPKRGFLMAIRYVLKCCLKDLCAHAVLENYQKENGTEANVSEVFNAKDKQRASRAVAACLHPTISLLRRLTMRSLIVGSSSNMSNVLSRMKSPDLALLIRNKFAFLPTILFSFVEALVFCSNVCEH